MKVYMMYHMLHGTGPIATRTEDVINEIECELNDFGEDAKLGYTKANLTKLKKTLEALQEEDINNATITAFFGPFRIAAGEMAEEQYDSLPVFDRY